jgi:hypothetical protein
MPSLFQEFMQCMSLVVYRRFGTACQSQPLHRSYLLCCSELFEMFPNVAIFGSESVECFPGTVSKLCLKPFVTYSGGCSYDWFDHTFHVQHSLYLCTESVLF